MKQHLDISHTGTTTGQKVRMRMHEDAVVKLMSTFIDLYSDRMLAVIREYATNARDSHIAAGIKDPIEVFLPNSMKPTFIVRDHGLGMSKDDIIDLWSAYGYSSKDDSDDFNGMLGLGSKAGLTYSSQFTVRAVKDGRQTVASIIRDSDGCGAVEIIDERDTLDRNGVEIQVPVDRIETFNEKAVNFYRFWESGTVVVNGKAPASIFDSKSEYKPNLLDEDVALLTTGTVNTDYIIMGNVAYPVTGEHSLDTHRRKLDRWGNPMSGVYRNGYIVARVPIGAVDFAPSREALDYTKRTVEVLADIRGWVSHTQNSAALAEVAAAADKPEALELAQKWRAAGINPAFTFQGSDVPRDFPTKRAVRWAGGNASASARGVAQSVQTKSAMDKLHIVGFKASRLDPTTKAKISKYVADNGIDLKNHYPHDGGILCYADQPHADWLPADRVVDISVIRAVNLGTAAPVVRKAPKFRLLNRYGHAEEADALPTGKTLVVLDSFVRNPSFLRNLGVYATQRGAVVVLVAPSKRAAFFRTNKCVDYTSYLKREARQAAKGCTPIDVLRMRRGVYHSVNGLEGTAPDTVLDPDVAALLEEAQEVYTTKWDKARYDALSEVLRSGSDTGIFTTSVKLPLMATDDWADRMRPIMERYPVLHSRNLTQEQRVEILNALYYARNTSQTTTTNDQEN